MYSYIAYGLSVSSEFEFPELIEVDAAIDENAEVQIRKGEIDLSGKPLTVDSNSFLITDVESYYFIKHVACFNIRQGREIVVDCAPDVNEQLMRIYLLGRILGNLLHQRRLLVLHGSAVALDGGAVSFLGSSGSGKSTAAASMIHRGHPIVADDLVVIDTCSGAPVIYPAFPQINLLPDVVEFLGYDSSAMPYVSPMEKKHIARFDHGFSFKPMPLKQIFLLDRGEFVDIKKIDSKQAMIELVRNSYAVRSLNAGANLSPHFLQCANVVRNVPVFRISRPFDLAFLDDFARKIEDNNNANQ